MTGFTDKKGFTRVRITKNTRLNATFDSTKLSSGVTVSTVLKPTDKHWAKQAFQVKNKQGVIVAEHPTRKAALKHASTSGSQNLLIKESA